MARNWTNDTGTALSASNLNALEADVTAALGVPMAALAGRLQEAGAARTALDGRYAQTTALNNKQDVLGTGTTSQFLRGDLTWAEPPAGGGGSSVTTFEQLQAAVAEGGVINMGTEVINITTQVNITVPVWIIGGRFTLPESAGYAAFNVTSSNVTFFLTSFTGAGTAAAYDINSRFITASGSSSTPLTNVNVINTTMEGCQSENIRLVWTTRSTVAENYISDFLYAGVMMLSCADITVSDNHIVNAVMKAPVVNVYGIAATDSVNTVAGRSRNIKIIGNTIKNVDWEGIDTHGGDGIVVVGNTLEACARGIALVVGNASRLTVPINCVVSGNVVNKGSLAVAEREAISLFGLAGNLAHAVITGNKVTGYSATNSMFIEVATTDPLKTLVEGNSHPHVPWTTVTMDNTANWSANAQYPLQYMVDGRTVYLRGLSLSVVSTAVNAKITTLPAICKPNRLTFAGATLANNAAGSMGVLGIYDTGELWMLYRRGADSYSYTMDCTFQRNFTG